MKDYFRQLCSILCTVFMLFGNSIYALPVFDNPSDVASVKSADGLNMTITTSNRQIINCTSFDIASGENVQFVQPSANSAVLGRVTGGFASAINGGLFANGNVFLVNPNGIVIGSGATINVGSFVASSLNISDADFMAGNYNFSATGAAAPVINSGTIIVDDGGYVGLFGSRVSNKGIIQAKAGKVMLGAGSSVSVDFSGDGLLSFSVGGKTADALVENSGNIKATGGQVVFAASAADSIVNAVVNNTGVVEAKSIENKNGVIVLSAGSGSVENSGTLDVSGTGQGSVEIEAGSFSNTGSVLAGVDGADTDGIDADAEPLNGGIKVKTTGEIVSSGVLDATGAKIELAALGAVESSGELYAGRLDQTGASFRLGGISKVGFSLSENEDGAMNIADGAIVSGMYADVDDIIIDPNATVILDGHTVFFADYGSTVTDGGFGGEPIAPTVADGKGVFVMSDGSSINANAYNISFYSSDENSAGDAASSRLLNITNAGKLSFYESAIGSPQFELFGNIQANEIYVKQTVGVGHVTVLIGNNTVTVNGNVNNQDMLIMGSGSVLDIGGDFNAVGLLQFGTHASGSESLISVAGTVQNVWWINPGNGTLRFDGGALQTANFNGQGVYNLEVTNGSTLQLQSSLNTTNINVSNGTLDAANGNFAVIATTANVAAGSTYLTGTAAQTLTTLNNSGTFNCSGAGFDGTNLQLGTINNASGSKFVFSAASGAVSVAGTFEGLEIADSNGSTGGLATFTQTGAISATSFLLSDGEFVSPLAQSFNGGDFNVTDGQFKRFAGGDGTLGSPYQITDVYGLAGIGGSLGSANFVLNNDIDASITANWTTAKGFASAASFSGVLNGQYNVISGLNSSHGYGLINVLDGGTVQNIGFEDVSMNSVAVPGSSGGAIAASTTNSALIENAYVTGSIANSGEAGMLVGTHSGGSIIRYSYAQGAAGGNTNVGGLVAQNNGATIENSYSMVNLWSTTAASMGGIAGSNDATGNINHTYAVGSIRSAGGTMGGIIGSAAGGTFSSNFWDTESTGMAKGVGNQALGYAGFTGKTTAEMMDKTTYEGWNFTDNTWDIVDNPLKFLWMPNQSGDAFADLVNKLASYYPGNAVIDEILLDGYSQSSNPNDMFYGGVAAGNYAALVSYIFDNALDAILAIPGFDTTKVLGIGESAGWGADQASYITALFNYAASKGMSYVYLFDIDKSSVGQMDFSTTAAGFAALAALGLSTSGTESVGNPILVLFRSTTPNGGIDTAVDVNNAISVYNGNGVNVGNLFRFEAWNDSTPLVFNSTLADAAAAQGMSIVTKIEPWNYDVNDATAYNKLSGATMDAAYEAQWRQYVRDALAWAKENPGKDVKVSIGHEFNLDDGGTAWYPWQDDPAGYVRMYQNLNQIAEQEAAAAGIGNETYPFFKWRHPNGAHGVSGTVYTDNGTTPQIANSNTQVHVSVDGTEVGSGYTRADGSYYTLVDGLADGQSVMAYAQDGVTGSNVSKVDGDRGLTSMDIWDSTVLTGSARSDAVSVADMQAAMGSVAAADSLFTVSGGNLTTQAGTAFGIKGTFNGSTSTVTVTGDWHGNIGGTFNAQNSTVVFNSGATQNFYNTSGAFNILEISNGSQLDVGTDGLLASTVNVNSGTLNCAANNAGSTVGSMNVGTNGIYLTGTSAQVVTALTNSGVVECNGGGGDGTNLQFGSMTNNAGSMFKYTKTSGTGIILPGTYANLELNDTDAGDNTTYQFTNGFATNVFGTMDTFGGITTEIGSNNVHITGDVRNYGTFTIWYSGILDIDGNFSNAGSIWMPPNPGDPVGGDAPQIFVGGNMENLWYLNAGISKITFDGGGTVNLDPATYDFNDLVVDNNTTVKLLNDLTVNTYYKTSGSVDANGNTFTYSSLVLPPEPTPGPGPSPSQPGNGQGGGTNPSNGGTTPGDAGAAAIAAVRGRSAGSDFSPYAQPPVAPDSPGGIPGGLGFGAIIGGVVQNALMVQGQPMLSGLGFGGSGAFGAGFGAGSFVQGSLGEQSADQVGFPADGLAMGGSGNDDDDETVE